MSDLMQEASSVVREAAARRPGEKIEAAIQRAADLLGITYRTTYRLYYRQVEQCSPAQAKAVVEQREAVLLDRLRHTREMTRIQALEAERILSELDEIRRESPCQTASGSVQPARSYVSPNGSVLFEQSCTTSPKLCFSDLVAANSAWRLLSKERS